jgi:hypothetical protein
MGLSVAFCLAPFGWLMIFALGCVGLGAVVLTRFGTMAYAPSTARPSPPKPSSGQGPSRPTSPPPAPASVEVPEPPEPPAGEAENDET